MKNMLGSLGRAIAAGIISGAVSLFGGSAVAQGIPAPQDKPILVVSGKITVTNVQGTAAFDRATLESLGMVSFTTTTPWYKDPSKFEGVPLKVLMQRVGATGTKIRAIALNDYSAEIPIEDAQRYNVILALKRDGQYMPIRDKGPLFVVYPFDTDADLKNQKFYSRCVWEVARMEVH